MNQGCKRIIRICFILTIFSSTLARGMFIFKMFKVAKPIVRYGLPALPIAYVCVKEVFYRWNRLGRMENTLNEVNNNLDALREESGQNFENVNNNLGEFREESGQNFENVNNNIEGSKKEVLDQLHVLEATVNNIRDELGEFREETGENFRLTRGDIERAKLKLAQDIEDSKTYLANLIDTSEGNVKQEILDSAVNLEIRLDDISDEIKDCANRQDVRVVRERLQTISAEQNNLELEIIRNIRQSEARQKDHLTNELSRFDILHNERFVSLRTQGEEIKNQTNEIRNRIDDLSRRSENSGD